MRIRVRAQYLYVFEATLIGLFFIQAFRFLIGMIYSRVSGAAVVAATGADNLTPGLSGVVDPARVSGELAFVAWCLLIPLLALPLGRFRPLMMIAAITTAVARWAMIGSPVVSPVGAASLVVGAGLLYLALLIRHRATTLPFFFLLGLGFDQLLRAAGNTLDPSWSAASTLVMLGSGESAFVLQYQYVQIALSIITILLAVATTVRQRRELRGETQTVSPDRGLLPAWGGIGLGALLFLQVALLALPNAIAGRAGVDYTTFVPVVLLVTTLPLVRWIRARARTLIALFDGSVRGWAWMLFIALLVVVGTRFSGAVAGGALVLAQFGVSLMWWWLVRQRAERERSFTPVWILLGVAIFAFLAVCDFFTYEYAYVRDFGGDLAFLNPYIPPLLRGFRGMGLGVLLLAVFLGAIPMTQSRRRIPWAEARVSPVQSLLTVALIAVLTVGAALAARPPVIQGVRGVDSFRAGTYNIHAGYNEVFNYDLEAIAHAIQQSGANVVLLQEVETGRMTSFGVDQALWLARRLGMDRRYYPTNEGLSGLATLSNVPIVYHQGTPLSSVGQQTGLQHVQVSADGGVSAIAFYNTWLGLLLDLGPGQSVETQEQDQQRQLAEIFGIITRDYPDLNQVRIVVGGTFNNVPGSPLIEQMRLSGFNDPFAGLPAELSATLWRSNARARFDYLWARNVLPLGAIVMESSASDHRMAVVEILINRRLQ